MRDPDVHGSAVAVLAREIMMRAEAQSSSHDSRARKVDSGVVWRARVDQLRSLQHERGPRQGGRKGGRQQDATRDSHQSPLERMELVAAVSIIGDSGREDEESMETCLFVNAKRRELRKPVGLPMGLRCRCGEPGRENSEDRPDHPESETSLLALWLLCSI
eukprot:528737-Rhodomonas_salina.2